jgi:hypothetical protein
MNFLWTLLRRLFGFGPDPDETPTQRPAPPRTMPPVPRDEIVDTEPSSDEESTMSRPTLRKGAGMGDLAHLRNDVKEAQALMNKHGESLTVDGQFGSGTEAAVKRVQKVLGLAASGVVDTNTWAVLDKPKTYLYQREDLQNIPLAPDKQVSGSGKWPVSSVISAWNTSGGLISALAKELGIASSAACAVLAVESAGKGFEGTRQIIRFENHVFSRRAKVDPDIIKQHFKWDGSKPWKEHYWRSDPSGEWIKLHARANDQSGEWDVLTFARTLDDTAALQSISMGSPQIMGFNSALIGYPSVQAMFEAFNESERAHVLGLFDFILSDNRMVEALPKSDWRSFAYVYNGSGKADSYGEHIKDGVEAAKNLGIP